MRLRDIVLASVTAGMILTPKATNISNHEVISEERIREYRITTFVSPSSAEVLIENTDPIVFPYMIRAVLSRAKDKYHSLAIKPQRDSPWCVANEYSQNKCPEELLAISGILIQSLMNSFGQQKNP